MKRFTDISDVFSLFFIGQSAVDELSLVMGIIDKKRDKLGGAMPSSTRPLSFWGGHKSKAEPISNGLYSYGGSTGHLDYQYGYAGGNGGLRPAISMPVVAAPDNKHSKSKNKGQRNTPAPPPPPLIPPPGRHNSGPPKPPQSITRLVRCKERRKEGPSI